jgi:outer membrane receptor protein involved in Fe transport
VNSAAVPVPRFSLPSYSDVDLRAGLYFQKSWRLNFYVRNLFNEHGVVTSNNRNGTAPFAPTAFLAPLTYGMSASYSF